MPVLLILSSIHQYNKNRESILIKVQKFYPIILVVREERREELMGLYCYLSSNPYQTGNPSYEEIQQKILPLRRELEEFQSDILYLEQLLDPKESSLFVFDMDSTLIQEEVIDELARMNGKYDEVARVTKEAMEGGLKFEEALQLRVKYLKGLPENCFQELFQRLHLNPGVEDTLHSLKKEYSAKRAVLSGGFSPILEMFSRKYDLDYYEANHLTTQNGFLTGELEGRIVGKERKKQALIELREKWKINPTQVVAVGDGANDADMLKEAGIGIGFHAKKGLKDKIYNWIDYQPLTAVTLLFGPSLQFI